jgi:hypothetical protein
MVTFPKTRWQDQQFSSTFPMVEPPKYTALDVLSMSPPSFLTPGMRCESMDISQSLDISETRFSMTHGDIVLTETSTVLRYTVTYRSVFTIKK